MSSLLDRAKGAGGWILAAVAAAGFVLGLSGCDGRAREQYHGIFDQLEGMSQLHVHWEEARLRPAYFHEDDLVGNGFLDDRVKPLQRRVENAKGGLRLTIPFDFGWPGPNRGPHWMPDPGYPTGPYSTPVLLEGIKRGEPR